MKYRRRVRLAPATLVIGLLLLPLRARAQYAGFEGGQEQQEISGVLLLGPEGTALGAVAGGALVYAVERNCCTARGDAPAVAPYAIGAGVGATIAATLTVWSVCNHFHPGSRFGAAVGSAIGSAAGAAFYFGGPGAAHENFNDSLFRFLAFLLLPGLGGYAGWHIGPMGYGGGDFSAVAPTPIASHVGPARVVDAREGFTLQLRF